MRISDWSSDVCSSDLNVTTHAKICGLSEPATLDAAVRGGASYVGFVFFSKSPRNVMAEQAAMLASRVADHVGRVGVFVDPDDAQVKERAEEHTSELQSLMRISYAVFCLQNKNKRGK